MNEPFYQPEPTVRRAVPRSATDRRVCGAVSARKASAEVFIGSPGALRRLLNGASVSLADADTTARLMAVRAAEQARRQPMPLFLSDIDAAMLAARWARLNRRRAA